MAEDKKPMPVDGEGTDMNMTDENGELASRRDAQSGGLPNAGESGGGAYPNPHSGKEGNGGDGPDKRMGHGGQSGMGYFGKGQLGEKEVGETENAPAKED